jgi:hypothetical protein
MATNTVSGESRDKHRVQEELCDSESSQLHSESGGGEGEDEDYDDQQESVEGDETVEISPCGRFKRVP